MTQNPILKIIYPVVFITGLQSCLFSNCNEIKLSKEDKSWMAPYNNVESVVFKSDQNNLDTFFFKERSESYTTCTKIELGPNIYNSSGMSFQSKNTSKKSPKGFYIGLTKDYFHELPSGCIIDLDVFDLNLHFDSIKDLNFEIVVNLHNQRKYYTIRESRESGQNTTIKSYNWSKKSGLMRYEMNTGEFFHLISKHIVVNPFVKMELELK